VTDWLQQYQETKDQKLGELETWLRETFPSEGQKGGPGSGNWRHTGLAGVHGGADAGGGLGTVHSWSPDEYHEADRQLGDWFSGWVGGLESEEKEALNNWVYYGNYQDINAVMRGKRSIRDMWGDKQLKIEETVPRLDAALEDARMPATVSTKRAICDSAECVEVYGSLEPGDEFTDSGYVSTGALMVPGGFAKRQLQANVIIPKGSKAGYLENIPYRRATGPV